MDSSQNAASNYEIKAEKHAHAKKILEQMQLAQASYNAADVDSAIVHLSEAAKVAVDTYGNNAKESIEPLFTYGSALLGRALLNDKFLSTMPNEQAMWFETVTGHPKPDLSVQPKDLTGKSDEKKSPRQQENDIKLSVEILQKAANICMEFDDLLKAVIMKCLEVAEILKSATSESDPAKIKSNLKCAFEREFPVPDYVKKPKIDDFHLA